MSPVQLSSFFLHSALFVALSSSSPVSVITRIFRSLVWPPSPLFPGMSTSIAFFLLCAPLSFSSHGRPLQTFSVIFLDACTTPVVPLMCSFRILSFTHCVVGTFGMSDRLQKYPTYRTETIINHLFVVVVLHFNITFIVQYTFGSY